jgi:hypothetical protein
VLVDDGPLGQTVHLEISGHIGVKPNGTDQNVGLAWRHVDRRPVLVIAKRDRDLLCGIDPHNHVAIERGVLILPNEKTQFGTLHSEWMQKHIFVLSLRR